MIGFEQNIFAQAADSGLFSAVQRFTINGTVFAKQASVK